MKLIFKEWKPFLIIFICILITDIIFSNVFSLLKYRYISKQLLTTTLFIHFYYNSAALLKRDRVLVFFALLTSFIADFFIINDSNLVSLSIGMFMYILAKNAYAVVFSYRAKFNIDRLLPFLAVTLLYCITIIYFLYDGIGKLFVPVIIYIFSSLIVFKMAYLRYKRVSSKSYYFALFGAVFFIFSESILSLNIFYKPISHVNITVMLFYGLSQILTIKGIIEQNNSRDQ